jgi:hypothetical protein
VDSLFLRKSLAQSLDRWMRDTRLNRSGISTSELAAAQVYTAISTNTSDLFGNAAVEPFDPIDHEAPVVSFVAPEATLYTRDRVITLRVRVQDRSDVKGVYARAGSRTFTGTRGEDGLWTVAVTELPVVGHNPVTVWAEDAAEPATNSGLGVEGHQLTADVMYDPNPPAVTYDSEFAAYADERGMAVAADANGMAVVPARYQMAHPRAAIPRGGDIFKAATRLAGGAVNASEIERTNAANVPVLRFGAPYNAAADSPIVQANYSVEVSCAGCPAFPTATGALVASPSATATELRYLLPLGAEQVPALRQLTGPGAVNVRLQLADAAGNVATAGPFAFTFHVVGPPVAVAEDVNYATYRDQWSTFAYGIGPEFQALWDASVTFTARNVRLVRYVLSNPAREPVAIAASFAQSPGGSWKSVESWRAYVVTEPGGGYLDGFGTETAYTVDGFRFWQYLKWAYPYGSPGAGVATSETSPWPCAASWEQGGIPAHRVGDTGSRFVCAPPGVTTYAADDDVETAAFSSGDVVVETYTDVRQDGRESRPPESAGGMLIVAAATDGGPGTLVVYLTRSASAPRSRPLQWGRGTGSARFETWDWMVWRRYYTWLYRPSAWGAGYYEYHSFTGYRRGRYLASMRETLDGGISVMTRGVSAANVLMGEPLTGFTAQLSRDVIAR